MTAGSYRYSVRISGAEIDGLKADAAFPNAADLAMPLVKTTVESQIRNVILTDPVCRELANADIHEHLAAIPLASAEQMQIISDSLSLQVWAERLLDIITD